MSAAKPDRRYPTRGQLAMFWTIIRRAGCSAGKRKPTLEPLPATYWRVSAAACGESSRNKQRYFASNIAWVLMTGEWPIG